MFALNYLKMAHAVIAYLTHTTAHAYFFKS